MPRFSKLKKRIESLFAPDLGLGVYCTVYQTPHYYGTLEIPRLWVTLNKEIIFDFIKDFKDIENPNPGCHWMDSAGVTRKPLVYWCQISEITNFIQTYIETPVDMLFDHTFETDYFGFAANTSCNMDRDSQTV